MTRQIVQSWDTAIKAGEHCDYSVCTTWLIQQGHYYLRDVMREKMGYPALKRMVRVCAEKWQPHAVLIEDKASGHMLLQDLREEELPLIGITPTLDKVTRFAAVTPLFEARKVYLPKQAAWLADFEAELLAFPHAPHDDQVDSVSQFLQWIKDRKYRLRTNVRVL